MLCSVQLLRKVGQRTTNHTKDLLNLPYLE